MVNPWQYHYKEIIKNRTLTKKKVLRIILESTHKSRVWFLCFNHPGVVRISPCPQFPPRSLAPPYWWRLSFAARNANKCKGSWRPSVRVWGGHGVSQHTVHEGHLKLTCSSLIKMMVGFPSSESPKTSRGAPIFRGELIRTRGLACLKFNLALQRAKRGNW